MNRENVVLVNENDEAIAEMEKLEAHKKGLLHRAFSVFIFNDRGEMLLQQRAFGKYHGSNLWSNTCCSHPTLGEQVKESAEERLQYEMGLNCNISFLFSTIYKERVENGLIEHEFDHVFFGKTNLDPFPNVLEVRSFKWIQPKEVLEDMNRNPEKFTIWFRKILPGVLTEIEKQGLITPLLFNR